MYIGVYGQVFVVLVVHYVDVAAALLLTVLASVSRPTRPMRQPTCKASKFKGHPNCMMSSTVIFNHNVSIVIHTMAM